MEERDLGGTGLRSSRLVLGTMTFGSQVGEDEARAMVRAALDAGITHFDTANSYNGGVSEEILGRALADQEGVVVASKVANRFADGPDGEGLSPKAISRAIDETLRRLGRDHVDLYYLHRPDRSVPIEATLATLGELVAAGKVRFAGSSNYAAWQIDDMLAIAGQRSFPPLRIAQQLYNPLSRGLEEEYAEFAATHSVATLVYNPLAGGLLTGKHRAREEPSAGRFKDNATYRQRYWSPLLMDAVDRLAAVAGEASLSLLELTFAWLLAQPVVDGVILGASSLAQLEVNLAAAARDPVPADVLEAVDGVWQQVRGPFPRYNR